MNAIPLFINGALIIGFITWTLVKGDTPVRPEDVIPKVKRPLTLKTVMQVLVSVAILASSLYIILSKQYTPQDQHWAYGSAGTILGFWLKGK